MMELGLDRKVVLVTGGSSGIGAALATAYGRQGAKVATTYRTNRDGAIRTTTAIEEAGGQAMAEPFDLANPAGAHRLIESILDRWQRLDVLVANAVAWPQRSPGGHFEDLPRSSWQNGLRTNTEGVLALVQEALPGMRAAGWGRLLFMSTGLVEEGMPGGESYTTAKAALHGLARSLSWDLGADGILVNVLAAGLTLTERNQTMLPDELRASIAARVPLGRLSVPEEVTAPALFLTSAANTSITGEVIREGSSTGRSSHTP